MLNTDEDALICDLAETYGVYDYRSLPVKTVATFSVGLRDDSRIKKILRDQPCSTEEFLLAVIADKLSFIAWTKTEDAQHDRNRPVSILEQIFPREDPDDNIETFASGDDFEARRNEIIEGRFK